MSQQSVLLDTNIVSIFAELDKLDLLVRVLHQHQLQVAPTVYKELSVGLNRGHIFLQQALDLIGEDKQIHVVSLMQEEANLLRMLPAWLGSGEAESIVICQSRSGIFTSFDRKAVDYCRNNSISVFTLNDILAALWVGKIVSKDEVRTIIATLEAAGRKIRAKSEILQE
jgi:predicted nucleic acid-binding protein